MFLMNVKSQDAEVVKKMNIVIFDGYTINPGDLSWDKLDALCDKLTVFDSTSEDKALSRLTGNEILMTSKCPITRELMENSPQLKYIGCTATGYNNIDVEAAADLGIAVTNIPAYSTDAVAQHTIALMLELSNHVGGCIMRPCRMDNGLTTSISATGKNPLPFSPGNHLVS